MNLYILSGETKYPVINLEKMKTGNEKFLMHYCGKNIEYYEVFDNLDEANQRQKTIESLSEEKVELLFD